MGKYYLITVNVAHLSPEAFSIRYSICFIRYRDCCALLPSLICDFACLSRTKISLNLQEGDDLGNALAY